MCSYPSVFNSRGEREWIFGSRQWEREWPIQETESEFKIVFLFWERDQKLNSQFLGKGIQEFPKTNQLTSKFTFKLVISLLSRRRPPCSRHRPSRVEVSALPWKFTTSGTGSRYSWECMETRITAHPWCLNCTLSSFFPPAFVCNFHQAAIQRGQP